jgi:hypothetical protein
MCGRHRNQALSDTEVVGARLPAKPAVDSRGPRRCLRAVEASELASQHYIDTRKYFVGGLPIVVPDMFRIQLTASDLRPGDKDQKRICEVVSRKPARF